MKQVRWGILSTATIAQQALIPAIERAENAKVVAIASSQLQKAQDVADHFSIEKTYGNYEALLDDPEIDAVYIPLPNHLHKEWVIAAAQKGKHILCEKPAALSSADFLEMRHACEVNKVLFLEAFMYQFHPQHARVKEIIASGEIGAVKLVRAAFSFLLDDPNNIRLIYQDGGGAMYDIGCYAVHTLRNIIGTEPNFIHAEGVFHPEHGVDMDVAGYLKFPDGERGIFDVSFSMAPRSEYEIIGTTGTIHVPRPYGHDTGRGLITVEIPGIRRTETVSGDQYRLQVEYLSKAILEGTTSLEEDLDNTFYNLQVMDACFITMHNEGI